jgi:hypothetical protein
LPGLTVHAAAAGHATQVALLVSILAGLVILVPALAFLFGLVLHGRFDVAGTAVTVPPVPRAHRGGRSVAAIAVALLVVGTALTVVGNGWVLAAGVLALVAFVVVGATELLRPETLEQATGCS